MEEMMGNIEGESKVFDRWKEWENDEKEWMK
jgi:hypothetical protein